MKSRHLIAPTLLVAMLAVSGAAFAQASGTDATTPAQGGDQNAATAGMGASSTAHKSTHKSHANKHAAKKPMNDTTNTPGADASSDTKGQ
ncbi:type IV secretory pathway TrbL component [Paraburkholderia bannensis]|uniref:Type IV secretory pathway TrbL component n=1 Tax=Paraburkholderia bannensis TaxID=765414 RepID=A0A7W9TZQ2_9BURK|nr:MULTISPECIES: hypothetical protein [Paraburkholderia]MBB3259372.1 type IV secretory pathway TrbL component [Paraburkholderia sp. WP4_3_2]MBB6104388.1 type IV secretory pathway TrbL component [Paraburkholderia bannensis]